MTRNRLSLLVIVLLFACMVPSYALDRQILILPPADHANVNRGRELLAQRWQQLHEAYLHVWGVEAISPQVLVELLSGDTIQYDTYALDIAVELGQQLEVDYVLLSEWLNERDESVRLVLVDPWEADYLRDATGNSVFTAIRDLESDRWIYGSPFGLESEEYIPPDFLHGARSVHDYLHENRTYPPEAAIQQVSATAKIRVVVSPSGVPLEVFLDWVRPETWEFQEPLTQALWALRYLPASVDGNEVNGLLERIIEVTYIR